MSHFLYISAALLFISILSAILGSFVIWNRLAYFSESLSHISLLGISLAITIQCDHMYMVILVALIFSVLFVKLKMLCSNDSILSIITSFVIAVAMLLLPWDHALESVFLGNLLLLNPSSLIQIAVVFTLVVPTVILCWDRWLLAAVNEEMAIVSGVNVDRVKLEFLFLLSIFISVIINVIGFFFVTALLIIPSATAGMFAWSPVSMVLISIIISAIAVFLGIFFSLNFDLAVGPTIILCSSLMLLICYLCLLLKNQGKAAY